MKKLVSILILGAFAFLSITCKKTKEKADEITEFDINYSTQISVPSQTMNLNVPVDFTTPDIPTQSSVNLASNKTTQSLVDYIKLTKFKISVGTGNLDFLKSLQIYVKAANMGEALVASKTSIPTGTTTIDADLQDVNIKDYIFQPNIQFRVAVTIDASTVAGQTLVLDETVHVKATVIK
jgi:hypothetical protein